MKLLQASVYEMIMLTLCIYHSYYYADLIENDMLNREAAKQSGLPEGETFTMAKFTYNNSAVVSRMFTHLQNTSFLGISVSMTYMLLMICYSMYYKTVTNIFAGK